QKDATTLGVARQSNLDNIRGELSPAPSPVASSPGVPGAPPTSDAEQRASGSRHSPANDSSSTQTEVENPSVKNLALGVQRKSSAMSLMNRTDSGKADAAISTSSANAFGKVDVPSQREAEQPSPHSRRPLLDSEQPHYHANHSYGGDDPTILRLLDSVFAENYP